MKKMAGAWRITCLNRIWTIRFNGEVRDGGRFAKLQPSTSDAFPYYEGWLRVDNMLNGKWDYMRLAVDGSLEMHHFCKTCNKIYSVGGLTNYWGFCPGVRHGTLSKSNIGRCFVI